MRDKIEPGSTYPWRRRLRWSYSSRSTLSPSPGIHHFSSLSCFYLYILLWKWRGRKRKEDYDNEMSNKVRRGRGSSLEVMLNYRRREWNLLEKFLVANMVVRMAPCGAERGFYRRFINSVCVDTHLKLASGVEFLQAVDSLLSMYNRSNTFALLLKGNLNKKYFRKLIKWSARFSRRCSFHPGVLIKFSWNPALMSTTQTDIPTPF